MSHERDCALDAEGERLKAVAETKPAPPRPAGVEFLTARRHAPMIAAHGLDMLRRVGFTAGGVLPAVEDLNPGGLGKAAPAVRVGRGETVVKADGPGEDE